jgi:hypothetical protein
MNSRHSTRGSRTNEKRVPHRLNGQPTQHARIAHRRNGTQEIRHFYYN